jgi:hypothetical protein
MFNRDSLVPDTAPPTRNVAQIRAMLAEHQILVSIAIAVRRISAHCRDWIEL